MGYSNVSRLGSRGLISMDLLTAFFLLRKLSSFDMMFDVLFP